MQAEKISSILKAANVNVEPYWPGMFAKASSGLDIRSIVGNVGTGVGGGGGGVVAAGGGGAPAAAASGMYLLKKDLKVIAWFKECKT